MKKLTWQPASHPSIFVIVVPCCSIFFSFSLSLSAVPFLRSLFFLPAVAGRRSVGVGVHAQRGGQAERQVAGAVAAGPVV